VNGNFKIRFECGTVSAKVEFDRFDRGHGYIIEKLEARN